MSDYHFKVLKALLEDILEQLETIAENTTPAE